MSEEERARAIQALADARARVAHRARIERSLKGDPAAMNSLLESWAPFWRIEPWEVTDDADLW